MEISKILKKKHKRTGFFKSAGAVFAGYIFAKTFPFSLFSKKEMTKKNKRIGKINISINPLAVSRKNIGDNNG